MKISIFPVHPASAVVTYPLSMALYGKYRPQNFTNLVGQDHIRETLLHEILKGTLTHAYLFAGPRGTGKTSTARLIAKALNCEKKGSEGEPCDECDFCKSISEGSLIDVIEIDAASNRGIDEIRDLKEKIQFAPTRSKTKTYIIDEVHMLTKEAFNALLKTLEEPPENVFFILCTTELHKIPETIVSRCQHFDFKRIDVRTIMTRLNYIAQMEGIAAEDAAIELVAQHVEGSMRDAIGLMEQMTIDNKLLAEHVRSHLGVTGHKTIETFLDVLAKKETAKAIHIINEIHNEGYDLNTFTREILECLRDKLVTGIQQGQPGTDLRMRMIEIFGEARDMLRNTVIPQLPLEIAAIKICGEDGVLQASTTEMAESETAKKGTKQKETSEESTQEETKTAQTLKQEFEIEGRSDGNLAKNWPRVLEHISPPSLKRSLGAAKIVVENDTPLSGAGNIKLVFNAKFHFDKVNLVESRAKIERAAEQVSGKKINVSCELVLQTAKAEFTPTQKPQAKAEKPAVPENLAKKVMEMFGEE